MLLLSITASSGLAHQANDASWYWDQPSTGTEHTIEPEGKQCLPPILGIETTEKQHLLATIYKSAKFVNRQVVEHEEFIKYLLAIIYVESRFNPNAVSHKEAYGLMQMTEIAVVDAIGECNLEPILDMQHLLDTHSNIRYGSCYLRKLLREMDGDWTRTLIAYNGGYRQVLKYEKGEAIASETANYVLQIGRIMECRE